MPASARPGTGPGDHCGMSATGGRYWHPAGRTDRAAAAARLLGWWCVAVIALAVALPAQPAAAGEAGTAWTFGINPAPGPDGHTVSYFSMTLGAGQSGARTAIIRNLGNTTETLKVSPSIGITATNGGTAYSGAFGACTG